MSKVTTLRFIVTVEIEDSFTKKQAEAMAREMEFRIETDLVVENSIPDEIKGEHLKTTVELVDTTETEV